MFEEAGDHGAVVFTQLAGGGVDGGEVGLELVLADLPRVRGEGDDDLAAVVGVSAADGPAQLLEESTLPGRSVLVGVDLGKPLIVAANGHAIAGGMLLVTAGDVRVVAAGARLALPELKLGLPGIGAARLSRELPPALAREVFFTGNPISAERAFDVGFVNHVVPASKVLAVAEGLAQAIAASAPLAVQSARAVMRAAVGMSDSDAIALERNRGAAVFASDDAGEGPLAYMEKRAPVFRGS